MEIEKLNITSEVREFLYRNIDKNLYYFRDFENDEYKDNLDSLLDYLDEQDIEKCNSIDELKDKMKEYIGDFIDGVIIYHSQATAYIGDNQLVEIPDWCETIYDWANYELNDEVYNSIEELE